MKILASVASLDEAVAIAEFGPDILDIKNPSEGSLGAQEPSVIQEVGRLAESHGIAWSASLGDLPFKPGTAALAAAGLAYLGSSFIKVGLHGTRTQDQATHLLRAILRAVRLVSDRPKVVAAGYGDYGRFEGLPPPELIAAAAATGCSVVMLDTAFKNGESLLDVMTAAELEKFVDRAKKYGLEVGLAGSLRLAHLPTLLATGTDILGVRSALCRENDRNGKIDKSVARDFFRQARELIMAYRTRRSSDRGGE